MTELNREDAIWLAGLLEGEGSFDLHKGRYARVRVGMTDRDVVGRAADLLGANVRLSLKPRGHKPMWHAEVSGTKAVGAMNAVLPFMGSRRSDKIAQVLGAVALGDAPTTARTTVPSAPGPRMERPPALR